MDAVDGARFWVRQIGEPLVWAVAALAALWFSLFSQSSSLVQGLPLEASRSFVVGLCIGLTGCGGAASLVCLKDSYQGQPLHETAPRLCAVLVGCGVVLVAGGVVAAAADAVGVSASLAGIAAGGGFGLVALVLFDWVGRRSVKNMAAMMAAALIVFTGLHGLGSMLTGAAALLAIFGFLALAVVALRCSRASAPVPSYSGEQEERRASERTLLPQRLLSLGRSSWGLVVVMLVSMFMLGFNWDPSQLSLFPVRPRLLALEETGGAVAAAAVLSFLQRAGTSAEALARLQWGIVPVVVATFVVVPYFPLESTGAVFYEIVGLVRCASVFIFAAGFMVVLAASARIADASLVFVAALALVLDGGCLAGGFWIAKTLGVEASVVVVLMFVAYLVITVAVRSVSRGDEQKVREIEREVFDAYLRQRCAAITAAYGLSPRESEMLVWLSRGHGYVYIAELAFVSEGTVRTHAKNIFRKCGVSSREELIDLVDERPLP